MATFDKKVLTNLRNKAAVAALVMIGLVSCNSNTNVNEKANCEAEFYYSKIDSLLKANQALEAKVDSCANAKQKSGKKAAPAKERIVERVIVREEAPKATAAAATRESEAKQNETIELEAASKSTFKVVASDSVKIGTIRAQGNGDGETDIQIVGGAQIDELVLEDYRTKLPEPKCCEEVAQVKSGASQVQQYVAEKAPVAPVAAATDERPYTVKMKIVKTISQNQR